MYLYKIVFQKGWCQVQASSLEEAYLLASFEVKGNEGVVVSYTRSPILNMEVGRAAIRQIRENLGMTEQLEFPF